MEITTLVSIYAPDMSISVSVRIKQPVNESVANSSKNGKKVKRNHTDIIYLRRVYKINRERYIYIYIMYSFIFKLLVYFDCDFLQTIDS